MLSYPDPAAPAHLGGLAEALDKPVEAYGAHGPTALGPVDEDILQGLYNAVDRGEVGSWKPILSIPFRHSNLGSI